MSKKPLICMFKATFDPGLVFPEDGVCDLSFFGALEQKHAFLKDEGGEYNASLDAFLAAAGKQHKTEHGVSLDHSCHLKTAEVLKDPVSKETVKKLWGKKIYHWGFLTTDVYRVTEVNMTLLFEILKYCKNTNYEFGFQESEPIAPYYVSQKERRFISFDDSSSLGIKLCKGKKKLLDTNYGLIVYSTEMDDPTNQCGKGVYTRVKSAESAEHWAIPLGAVGLVGGAVVLAVLLIALPVTPMSKKPLICMFKATFDPGLVFPEDGVCDLSFFGALEQKHAFLKDEGGEYNASLDAFLAAAGKQHKTEHGVSLDHS
ncbi:hypothetical protein HPB51_028112 [Rhipicephalus microplus]|uniref:Uncharacterized protein n=1 Tax=Rhipicephalus microplus TaxID=6941 RepID=A0A9J6CYR4_RHIMP|nr:hypothetical protein HPB51_028112 [Rhipicephalus microplus]